MKLKQVLKKLPKEANDLYAVYDIYSFDILFHALLEDNYDYEDALSFVLANCSLSALVFQERIHNDYYYKISADSPLPDDLIEAWESSLFIIEEAVGSKFKEAILKKVAEVKKVTYKLASFEDESKGIDGYIGDGPVSIKPVTYKTKPALQENINAKFIYYKKIKGGIEVEYE